MNKNQQPVNLDNEIFSDLLITFLHPRIKNVDDVRKMVSALDELDEHKRNRLFKGLSIEDTELQMLFNAAWLSIENVNTTGFEEYLSVLYDALEKGKKWNYPSWIRTVSRMISSVLDESLGRRHEAEKIILDTIEQVGTSLYLTEQLACLASHNEEFNKAIQIWKSVLDEWNFDKTSYCIRPVFASRDAGISAAKLNRWGIAAEFFQQGIQWAINFRLNHTKIGFEADLAFVYWIQNKKRECLLSLFSVLKQIDSLSNVPSDFREFAVRKLSGAVFVFISGFDKSALRPEPGMCSNPLPHPEIKNLPPVPNDFLWFQLYLISAKFSREGVDSANEVAQVAKINALDGTSSNLKFLLYRELIKEAIELGNSRGVLALAKLQVLELSASVETLSLNSSYKNLTTVEAKNSMVFFHLVIGILIEKLNKNNIAGLINNWEEDCINDSIYIQDKIKSLKLIASVTQKDLYNILYMNHKEIQDQFLAALILLGSNKSGDDAIYSQSIFLNIALGNDVLYSYGGELFCALIKKEWQWICEKNKSSLVSPRDSVKRIIDVCNINENSWEMAAKIYLASLPAVSLNVPNEIINKIKNIFDREPID